jgi:phosphatidylglycerophosphate synthase
MTDSEHKNIEEYRKSSFFKDFSVGCGTLVLLGLLIFVVLPLVAIVFKVALWLAVPIVVVALIVVFVALLGRFVSKARKHW